MWLTQFGNFQEIIMYIFASATALNVVLALAVLIVACCFRTSTPGSSMDINIVFGGLLLLASVMLRNLKVEWLTMQIMETICQFHPALVTFGLLWFIGSLLMKASAIYHYYKGSHLKDAKQVSRYECLPHLWLIFFMIIDVAIMLTWVLKYSPRTFEDPSGNNMPYCKGPEDTIFYTIIGVIHALLLIFAAIIIWFAVHVSRNKSSCSETTLLSVIIYNTLFVALAAALVYFLGFKYFKTNMQYIIIGGLMNYGVFAAFLFVLIGKVMTARQDQSPGEDFDLYDRVDQNKGATNRSSTSSDYHTAAHQGQAASTMEGTFPY